MNNETPLTLTPVSETVKSTLLRFFNSLGRHISNITDDTDLMRGTGASSDEGVDFAIDLADALGADVPNDFNPFVHPSGKRAMTFRELVKHAERFSAARTETGHVK
jgi:hypothetical protein